jgi:transposase InsO family protein
MDIKQHKNARTTPAVRAEIAASTERVCVLAKRYGVTEATIYKWRARQSFEDRSHTAHALQTTLTPAQEIIVVEMRKMLLLPLDDMLAVTREFLCRGVSRSGLDRCLRRHGVGNLNALKPVTHKEPHKAFEADEPGCMQMDVKYLPQMADETHRSYLFVAIDRATRWVFAQIKSDKTGRSASSFLTALQKACPMKIQKLRTDNSKTFTDRLFTSREHDKAEIPKTHGMVDRFNGRIADVLKTNRFNSAEDLAQALTRYVALYNHQFPQSALKSKTPMQAMKDWYATATHLHLFHKRPYDRPG